MQRIKIEKKIDMIENFINNYPAIWIKRGLPIFQNWDELEKLNDKINKSDKVNEDTLVSYNNLLGKICVQLGLAEVVDFEELKKIKNQLEVCKDDLEYISHRKSIGALSEELQKRMEEIGVGGVFGSEYDELREKYGISRYVLAEIILKYGSIDNFRKTYIQYMIDLYSGKQCEKPYLCGAEKHLVQGFDMASPDLIFRRTGIGLLCEDIVGKNHWFIESDKLKRKIDTYMKELKERIRDIVNDYYGIGVQRRMQLVAVSQKYEISDTRILQIKDAVIKRLRNNILEIKDIIKQNELEPIDMGNFIKEFFSNHDIFYDFYKYDLDLNSRKNLIKIYEESLEIKIQKKETEKKKEKEQRYNEFKLERDYQKQSKREDAKKKIMEEALEKITLYELGFDIDTIGELPNVTIASWNENPLRNIDEKTFNEINQKIELLQIELAYEVAKNLAEEKIDYEKENIRSLGLSVRALHALQTLKIVTIDQLIKLTQEELMNIKNLGEKTFKEINDVIHSLGLCFANEENEYEIENYRFVCNIDDILDNLIDKSKVIRPIEELGLSLRTYNVLKRYRVNSIEKLIRISPEELLKFNSLGEKCYREIVEKVHAMGYKFMYVENSEKIEKVSKENGEEELEQDLEFVIQSLRASYEMLRKKEAELEELMKEIKYKVDYQTTELGVDEAKKQLKKLEELKVDYESTKHKRKLKSRELKKAERDF